MLWALKRWENRDRREVMRGRGSKAQTERKIDSRSGRERRRKADRHTPWEKEEERQVGGSSFSSAQTPTSWLGAQ